MAQKLSDVALRRTDLATGEYPGEETMKTCGDIMAKELGWNRETVEREIQEIKSKFPGHVFAPAT
jgi:glycerol-3-phosphate dehydrogenase